MAEPATPKRVVHVYQGAYSFHSSPPGPVYHVTGLINLIEPQIGLHLHGLEIQELIDEGVEVNITERKT